MPFGLYSPLSLSLARSLFPSPAPRLSTDPSGAMTKPSHSWEHTEVKLHAGPWLSPRREWAKGAKAEAGEAGKAKAEETSLEAGARGGGRAPAPMCRLTFVGALAVTSQEGTRRMTHISRLVRQVPLWWLRPRLRSRLRRRGGGGAQGLQSALSRQLSRVKWISVEVSRIHAEVKAR